MATVVMRTGPCLPCSCTLAWEKEIVWERERERGRKWTHASRYYDNICTDEINQKWWSVYSIHTLLPWDAALFWPLTRFKTHVPWWLLISQPEKNIPGTLQDVFFINLNITSSSKGFEDHFSHVIGSESTYTTQWHQWSVLWTRNIPMTLLNIWSWKQFIKSCTFTFWVCGRYKNKTQTVSKRVCLLVNIILHLKRSIFSRHYLWRQWIIIILDQIYSRLDKA